MLWSTSGSAHPKGLRDNIYPQIRHFLQKSCPKLPGRMHWNWNRGFWSMSRCCDRHGHWPPVRGARGWPFFGYGHRNVHLSKTTCPIRIKLGTRTIKPCQVVLTSWVCLSQRGLGPLSPKSGISLKTLVKIYLAECIWIWRLLEHVQMLSCGRHGD